MIPKRKKGSRFRTSSQNNHPPIGMPTVPNTLPQNPATDPSSLSQTPTSTPTPEETTESRPKQPASRIPTWTGVSLSTPTGTTPTSSRTVSQNTTNTIGLGPNLRPLPLPSFTNSPIPSLPNTPATPTLVPKEVKEEVEEEEQGGDKLQFPKVKQYEDDNEVSLEPKSLNTSRWARKTNPDPCAAPASEAPSTPDLKEHAIASSSEEGAPLSTIDSPDAQIAQLFAGPAPQLGGNDAPSESETESQPPIVTFSPSGLREEESQASAPFLTPSRVEDHQEIASNSTPTPNSSSRRAFRPVAPTSAPLPPQFQTSDLAPAFDSGSEPTRRATSSDNSPSTPPPGSFHPLFINPSSTPSSTCTSPLSNSPRDRLATMGTDGSTPASFRQHRSERVALESALYQDEVAVPSSSESGRELPGEKKLASFKPREIAEFQRYAEGREEDEGVTKGMKALEAATRKEREQMIEHLTLANVNRELCERMSVVDQELKRYIEEARKERKVGQYSQENMEDAVLLERNKRKDVEEELKHVRKAANASEFEFERKRAEALADAKASYKADLDELKLEAEERDEALSKLRAEKGDWISKEQCAEFNANACMKMQDKIAGLEMQLEAARASEGSRKKVDGRDETLLTEDQCNERCAALVDKLQHENDILLGQLNDADEALRRCRQANCPDKEAPKSELLMRHQINDLCHELDKCKTDNETMRQLLKTYGVYEKNGPGYEELQAANRKLKMELWQKQKGWSDLVAHAQSLEAANEQLNEDIKTVLIRIAEKDSWPETPALIGSDEELIAALQKDRVELTDSQTVLRQKSQDLRDELHTTKEKLAAMREERNILKEVLRGQDDGNRRLGPTKSNEDPGDPELSRCKEKNRAYEHEVFSLKQHIEDSEASFKEGLKKAETEATKLQERVDYLTTTIATEMEHCEESKKALEGKIAALEEAKADRERQIDRQQRKFAKFECGELDSPVTPPVSLMASSAGNLDEIPASSSAMKVVLIRCEIQLGQLQADRKRWGFIDGDAANAIEVATEAQGMAERLDDSKLIGRAAFWRGITEFMAGNSTAAEVYLETSASHHWTETRKEKKLLQEWWNMSKTGMVNKSTPFHLHERSRPPAEGSESEHLKLGKSDCKKKDKKSTNKRDDRNNTTRFKGEKKKKHRKYHKNKKTETKLQVPASEGHEQGPSTEQANTWCETVRACWAQ